MLTVAVLFGGRGVERAVSCLSADAVLSHIPADRFRALPVGIDAVGNFWLYEGDLCKIADGSWETDARKKWIFPIRRDGRGFFQTQDEEISVDAVLPILHGDGGEDGSIQGLFSVTGIPYAGADVLGSSLCFDKVTAKRIAESQNVPVVPWISVMPGTSVENLKRRIRQKFGVRPFPLFVKPSALGSSVGAAKVRTYRGLLEAISLAAPYGEVLIEKFIGKKREIEIAFSDGDLPLYSEPGEIRSKHGFYDYREKYETNTARIGKAHLSRDTEARIYRYARNLLSPLHIRDLCRFDFFLTDDGMIYFNEVNTMPGLTEVSLYPKLLKEAGIPFEALIERWVGAALDRRI